MSEKQLAFLYKAASTLQMVGNENAQTLLQSYYLMRCKQLSKTAVSKHLSPKVRCPRCCIEWRKGTQTKVKSLKLSKKQRRRIRTTKTSKKYIDQANSKEELLRSNIVEQICTFCKHTTVNTVLKPEKLKKESKIHIPTSLVTIDTTSTNRNCKAKKKEVKKSKEPAETKKEVNIYTNSIEVFSLNNKKNNLESNQKVETKVIKNNKKKKDKFAGLCQKAVMAAAKLKEESRKQNKLNLFLKPSS